MQDERQRVHRLAADEHVEANELALAKACEVVVEARVAARPRLQLVVEVEDDLRERKLVDEQHALGRRVLHVVEAAAPVVAELHHLADAVLGDDDRSADVRLVDALALGRHLGGVVHLDDLARRRRDLVRHGRRGHEQVEVELPLQPLADDLHVQEAEEPAAEAETERLRRLGLVRKGRVVEAQPLEGVAELRVLVRVGREERREHHRLDVLVARERLARRARLGRQRVADAQLGHVLQAGHDVTHLARAERVGRRHRGREEADLFRLEARALRHREHVLTRSERPVDDANEGDDAPVLVVRGVEDERARRRIGVAAGRRNALDDRVEHLLDPDAGLGGDPEHVIRGVADEAGELPGGSFGVGLRQVDLVRDRQQLEVVLDRQVRVRHRLRLDSLRRVDDEHRALARLQRPRDLVREVHVSGSVDQVQLVPLPRHPHGLGLDRDPALAFEVHRVEHLGAHVASRDRVRDLEDAIGQRRLPVVDVGDDREVADAFQVHEKSAATEAARQR